MTARILLVDQTVDALKKTNRLLAELGVEEEREAEAMLSEACKSGGAA